MGVKFGHPAKLTAHQRQEALQRLAEGEAQADVALAGDDFQAVTEPFRGKRGGVNRRKL